MTTISATMVKQLREKSGAGMMDCKQALVECDSDIDKAVLISPDNVYVQSGEVLDVLKK